MVLFRNLFSGIFKVAARTSSDTSKEGEDIAQDFWGPGILQIYGNGIK